LKYEIEIKLRLPGKLAPIRRRLRDAGFQVAERRALESNVLFDSPERSLSKQGKLIRVRRVGSHNVLTFKGPPQPGRHKKRQEINIDFPDAEGLQIVLNQIGYQPAFRYEKFRTEYSIPPGTGLVMLDETPIGNFLEIEGSPRWIDRTASLLGFSSADYITASYVSLYVTYCREHGITPGNMVFSKRS